MAQNKKYSAHLQKLRMSGASIPGVDPALNSYVLMLLRSNQISAIDDKNKPASKLSVLVDRAQHLSTLGDKHEKVLQALLRRICMNGFIPWNALVPLFDALHNQASNVKATRALHYLIGVILSCGSAGTPVPLLPAAGGAFTDLAVDTLPFTTYSAAWASLGDEEALSKQSARLALRHLTAATRCALTTLPAGKENDAKATQLLQDLKTGVGVLLSLETRDHKSKKKAETEIRSLQRAQAAALLAARAGLPRGEVGGMLTVVAQSFAFASPLGVRHGLALLCRIPSAKLKGALGPLSAPLRAAFDAFTPLGLMHGEGEGGALPAAGVMALDDWLARAYLGRLLAKLVFGGGVGGGQKQFLWKVLNRLAFSPKEKPQVRLEVWKALFGEVLPQPLALFPAGDPSHTAAPPAPFSEATEKQLASFRATAWHATTAVLVPKPAGGAGRRRGKAAAEAARAAAAEEAAGGVEGVDRFRLMVAQLLKMLESPSAATLCGGARALRCIAEARAHAAHAAGESYAEDARITEIMQGEVTPAVRIALEAAQGPAVKLPLLQALLWLHLPQEPTVTPQLLRAVVHSSSTASLVPGYAPWPPADVGAALQAVDRRIHAAPELTASLLTAVSAMASGAPSSMLPTAMLRLWTRATALEIAGGVHNGARDAALQAAIDLLAAPPPPMCSPPAGASQYDLAVGMKESHAWARLKDMAVTWLGDNANSATNELAWYPPPSVERKAPASHEKDAFGEPEMLALMAMRNPMLMAVVSQLQGTALAGAWNLRVAAAHALGKIAALSDEPFRFHCYTLLATLAGQDTDDTLGLRTSVAGVVATLDAMYAGQCVMKQLADTHGLEWSSWPPAAFEAVQRRHEEVVAEVRLHITPDVPDGAFFPLGIKSQLLLTGERVAVDEAALAEMQEAAIAKAARQWAERQRERDEAMALAGAEYDEAADAEFDDTASETSTSEQSIALETISIDETDVPELDIGAELDQEAALGASSPRSGGVDPNAWASAAPAGLGAFEYDAASSKLQPEASSSVLEALSSALSSSLPHHGRRPSESSAALPGAVAAAAAATPPPPPPQAAESDSDSDEEVTEAEAKAAIQSMGGGEAAAGQSMRLGGAALTAADSQLLESLSMPLSARAAAAAAGEAPASTPPPAVVAYGFEAEEAGELTVREGDEVYVIEYLDGGWAHVQLVATGEAGNVPEWAVEAAEAAPSAPLGPTHSYRASMDSATLAALAGRSPRAGLSSAHGRGEGPASARAGAAPTGAPFAVQAPAQDVVAGGEVTDDNPFGLIDISSPRDDDNTPGAEGPDATGDDDDPLGGLGDLYAPPIDAPATPPPPVAGTGSATELAGQRQASLLSPTPVPRAQGAERAGAEGGAVPTASSLPAVDNPFGAAAIAGDGGTGDGASAPTGDNPFEAVGASAPLDTGDGGDAGSPAPQFQGGVSDNPFGS